MYRPLQEEIPYNVRIDDEYIIVDSWMAAAEKEVGVVVKTQTEMQTDPEDDGGKLSDSKCFVAQYGPYYM